MNIAEKHVEKFRQTLKREGLPATQRFELIDAAWAFHVHCLSKNIDWLESNLAALNRMWAIIKTAEPFGVPYEIGYWFTYSGSSRAHYFQCIFSPLGITVAILKLVNNTPEDDIEALVSNYLQ